VVIGGYALLGRLIHNTGIKVGLVSLVASLVIAVITQFHFSAATVVTSVISIALMILGTRLIQFESHSELQLQDSLWGIRRD